MVNQNNLRIYAENGTHGLNVYLLISGQAHYIMTKRSNGALWLKLKDGATIGELKRAKSNGSRKSDHYHHSLRHLLKVVDEYIEYEYCAEYLRDEEVA